MFYPMKLSPYRPRFKKDAEAWSVDIRQQLGLASHVACPARCVAELYGVSVTPVQSLPGLVETDLSDLFPDQQAVTQKIKWLLRADQKFSAVVAIVREYKMVLYNADHSAARQESDIMHELAHIICEHPGDCLQLNADIALRQYNTQYEEEAKWLGATLQIPEQGLFQLVRNGHSNQAIAEIYGASVDMVTFRRNKLGIDIRLSRLKKYAR